MTEQQTRVEVKGLLFDLDGTLVDTSRDITGNLNRALESHGYQQLSHEIILSHVGKGAQYLVTKCLHHTDTEIRVDDQLVTRIWEKFREHYREHLVDESQPYPGVIDFISSENRPMGVISNKPEEFVRGVLRALNMDQHFKFMWGRDTLPVAKPDPQIIHYGIHELGIGDDVPVCMVGDHAVDAQAAQGAGAISVALASGFSSVSDLQQVKPDFLFTDFNSFAKVFKI